MKKTLITILAAVPALLCAGACTDYLYEGEIDLSQDVVDEENFEYPASYTYKHPCALVSASDIDRIKDEIASVEAAMAEAAAKGESTDVDKKNPVYASWNQLKSSAFAQPTYTPNPQAVLVRGDAKDTGVDGENYINACRDAAAAFQLGLRWQIEGNVDCATRAVSILNQWAAVCKTITANDNNQYLLAGFQGYQFANAAELLRDFQGWTEADQNTFKSWLRNLWYEKNYTFMSSHGGSGVCDLHYWTNWEIGNMASILAIGIFLEDDSMVNFAYKEFREGKGSGALLKMIPYDPVPDPQGNSGPIAQCMESGRDQGHATLVSSVTAEFCQMGWNMGIDFFDMYDRRVLAMFEYTAKYNVKPYETAKAHFVEYKYCVDCECRDHSHGAVHTQIAYADEDGRESRGTERPCWDLIYNHYVHEKGLRDNQIYYSKMFAEQLRSYNGTLTGDGGAGTARYGSNSSAYDQLGWGTLLFYRSTDSNIEADDEDTEN